MSCVHVVLFCSLIDSLRARHRKLTTFLVVVTRLSPTLDVGMCVHIKF